MSDPFTSLVSHADYAALPEQATAIKPDTGCAGCGLAQAAGHLTCSTFKLRNVPVILDTSRIDLNRMRQMQGQLHRRAFDSDGIIGSFGDPWYYHNASRAVNFVYFSPWELIAVSGDTVTVKLYGAGDARSVLHATWYGTDFGSGFKIQGYSDNTCVQALDMFEVQAPSAAAKFKAKILQVLAATATTLTLRLDKSYEGIAYQYILGEEEEAPMFPGVKIYHYGREAEQWQFLVDPYYFLGRRASKIIAAADLPTDGIWTLETAVICPPPETATLDPVFVLEGYDAEGVWQRIYHDIYRLHIKHDLACYSLKTTLPSGSIRNPLLDDLTATYSQFRATYYVKTTADNPNCRIVGYDRCFHSRVDHSYSAANYGTTLGVGKLPDTVDDQDEPVEGKHVYCSERVYEKYELVDEFNRLANPPAPGTDGIFDRVNVTSHHPTGLADFPTDSGQCILYGYCNKHVNSMDKMGDREAPFNIDYTMGFLRELWFACDKTKRQKYIGAFGPGGFITTRVAHPSIFWLNDYYAGLISPDGYNVHDVPRGNGSWFPVKPFTYIDANGDEHLRNAGGVEKGYRFAWDAGTSTDIVDANYRGNLPANVANFTTKRDPFTPGETVEDDLLEWIGCTVERDSLQIVDSRGLGSISMALGEEDIIAPNFDVGLEILQQHSRATFIKPADGDAVVTILPYRQEAKTDRLIGSRVIHSATSLSGHRWLIEYENTPHSFSRKNLGGSEPGDSYNEIFTVMAGGGPCILPYEHQALNSFDGEKTTGSRAAGAGPLDCIEFSDGSRFVIEYVTPHGGSEADGYGSRQMVRKGSIAGYYTMLVASGSDGAPLTPVTITSVVRQSDSQAFAVVEEDVRPVLLTEQVWFDGNQRLYFTALDDGDYLEIQYEDSAGTPWTVNYTVEPSFTVATEDAYTEWTGAVTRTVFIGTVAATVIVGGTVEPAAGEVRIDEVLDEYGNNGKISLTFCVDDAPQDWRLVLGLTGDAPDPQDDWATGGNYLAFARKRDVAVVRVDALAVGDYFSENITVGESVNFIQSATVFLPKLDAPQPVYWTRQGEDNWQPIEPWHREVNAASGTVTISDDFFAENFDPESIGFLAGAVCFKLPDIQMVDNRGQVPASLLNKTKAVLDAMRWRLTGMGSGRGAVYVAKGLTRSMGFGRVEVDPPDLCNPDYELKSDVTEEIVPGTTPSGNYYHLRSVGHNSTVQTRFSSSSFGLPIELENFTDGVEIAEAVAEISGSGLTRVHIFGSLGPVTGDGGVEYIPFEDGTYDVDLIDIDYVVIGFTSPTDYEVVGRIPGAANGQKVVSVTSLMQAMFDGRRNYPYGFGLLYIPNGGSMTLPPIDVSFVDVPTTESAPYHCPITRIYLARDITTQLRWDSLSFGKIALQVNYNGTDKLCLPGPRLPAMIDLPA